MHLYGFWDVSEPDRRLQNARTAVYLMHIALGIKGNGAVEAEIWGFWGPKKWSLLIGQTDS